MPYDLSRLIGSRTGRPAWPNLLLTRSLKTMSRLNDPEYLRTQQYCDASNLNARIRLHVRFSTNRYDWHRWVFDQLDLASESRLLELGCGPAQLWRENLDRIPAGWRITLSDFSPGMLQEAQEHLGAGSHSFTYDLVDAQSIPYPNGHFDAVIANHMLYHVPDRAKALSEIQRVLRPGGRFYAATNGLHHLRELDDLLRRWDPSAALWGGRPEERFSLETGQAELSCWFTEIELRRYEDGLVVTETEPLVAYILSGAVGSGIEEEARQRLVDLIKGELAHHGAIRITKDAGLFLSKRAEGV